jgi:AcrR family transcriptional regulator
MNTYDPCMEQKRSYIMRKRAVSQDETRQRIVEATMHLHEELGPRNTTIVAIAERAGVQRLTVYRHFPSEVELFDACTSHWIALNPPPDPSPWAGISDPAMRCVVALSELYCYFSRTQEMWRVSYRDVGEVPALHAPMARFEAYLDAVTEVLNAAFPEAQRSRIAVTLRHAATFQTWCTLDVQGLTDPMKAATVAAWLRGVAEAEPILGSAASAEPDREAQPA